MSIIIALIIFSLIIFVHELGHFSVAKWNKVDVEEFGMGFPPRIWGKKFGKTLYSINWIPIGGFVRMLGQDDFAMGEENKNLDKPGHFENKTPWARAQILVAGVLMNFLLAFLLFWIGYTVGTKPIFYDTEAFQQSIISVELIVADVVPDSPAAQAGLQADDIIIGINGEENLDGEGFIAVLEAHKASTVQLTIIRPEEHIQTVTELDSGESLDSNSIDNSLSLDETSSSDAAVVGQRMDIPVTVDQDGKLGIELLTNYNQGYATYPFYEAWIPASIDCYKIIDVSLHGLGMLVTSLVKDLRVPEEVAGPVGIVQLTSEVSQHGMRAILQFTAILSLSIGLINILPIPALDGGRLLFVFYEVIFRKKPNKITEGKIHMVGFLLLFALILIVTFNDILRLIFN